jgi:hypothetical protein
VGQLVAREQGLRLSGEGGVLQQLTKLVLESAPDGELTEVIASASAWMRPPHPLPRPGTGLREIATGQPAPEMTITHQPNPRSG